MQNRRPLLFLLILIPALLLVLLVNPRNLLLRDEAGVVLKQTDEVDRIVLADAYSTAELNRSGDTWVLFGTEQVNPVAVENLLIAAGRLEVSSIVSRSSVEADSDSRDDLREITFFKGDRQLLSYGLMRVAGKFLLLPQGSEQAYFVSLPGYSGLDLDRVFSATPDHYLDHLLIDLRPSDIEAIEIELASGEAFRFTQTAEGVIRCEPLNAATRLPDGTPNDLALRLLFSYFTSIRYEEHTGIPADSLDADRALYTKLARIRVESITGKKHSMEVYSYRENGEAAPHIFRALVRYNEEPEALVVNYIYLDVLMRGLSHYFGEKS